MAESIVTLGIGASPELTWFITTGLGVGAAGISFDFTRPRVVFEDAKKTVFEAAKTVTIENDKTVRFP
jgi:hypothetical protein